MNLSEYETEFKVQICNSTRTFSLIFFPQIVPTRWSNLNLSDVCRQSKQRHEIIVIYLLPFSPPSVDYFTLQEMNRFVWEDD